MASSLRQAQSAATTLIVKALGADRPRVGLLSLVWCPFFLDNYYFILVSHNDHICSNVEYTSTSADENRWVRCVGLVPLSTTHLAEVNKNQKAVHSGGE